MGENVQERWRPAHEEASDVIQPFKELPQLVVPQCRTFPPSESGLDGRPSWLSTDCKYHN